MSSAEKQLFIDMWIKAGGGYGTYDKSSNTFEMNGVTGIDWDEAR